MSKELIEETKKAMGYTEAQNTCEGCKHSSEESSSHVDRSWYWICKFSNLCTFEINKNGRCNKHEPK